MGQTGLQFGSPFPTPHGWQPQHRPINQVGFLRNHKGRDALSLSLSLSFFPRVYSLSFSFSLSLSLSLSHSHSHSARGTDRCDSPRLRDGNGSLILRSSIHGGFVQKARHLAGFIGAYFRLVGHGIDTGLRGLSTSSLSHKNNNPMLSDGADDALAGGIWV